MAKKKTSTKKKIEPKEVTVILKKGSRNFSFGKYVFKEGVKSKIPASVYDKNKSRLEEVKNG